VVSFDLSAFLEPGVHELGCLEFRHNGLTDGDLHVGVTEGHFVTADLSTGDALVGGAAGVGPGQSEPVTGISLTAVPNPTSGSASIRYGVQGSASVEVKVYSISGQAIRTLVDENQTAGWHEIAWDGRNDRGARVPDGIYFCHVRVSGSHETIKLGVLR